VHAAARLGRPGALDRLALHAGRAIVARRALVGAVRRAVGLEAHPRREDAVAAALRISAARPACRLGRVVLDPPGDPYRNSNNDEAESVLRELLFHRHAEVTDTAANRLTRRATSG